MPFVTLAERATAPTNASVTNGVSALSIAGFIVAGVVVLVICLWLGIRQYRKILAKKRQNKLGPAFLSVRGPVKEEEIIYNEKKFYSQQLPSFSRNNINSQIILPSKVLLKDALPQGEKSERDQIITQHRQSGTLPKPFSFALQTSTPPSSSPILIDQLSVARNSFAPSSRISRISHFSVLSTNSSYNASLISSVTPNGSTGAARSIRKVRQEFDPVLPDELLVRVGESLMILQSFDDGWCVVGRESGLLMPQPKALFGGDQRSRTPTAFGDMNTGVGTTSGGNVELGMVPAWCFLKPVKGLRAERPVRSSSLGVTVQMDTSNVERNDLISWSNF